MKQRKRNYYSQKDKAIRDIQSTDTLMSALGERGHSTSTLKSINRAKTIFHRPVIKSLFYQLILKLMKLSIVI